MLRRTGSACERLAPVFPITKAIRRNTLGAAATVAAACLGTVPSIPGSRWVVPAAAEPPEEMTVTGRYPGPPLWKVSAASGRATQ